MTNILSIKYIGDGPVCDLEVDHPDHQYYLSNGILTSNSHAIFYSMNGFQTAYLKAHYPVEYMTANLISEDESNAKISDKVISKIKRELRDKGIKILPPNINESKLAYTIQDSTTILTGFNSLKYMGKDAIPELLEKRPFTSFQDLISRVDGRKVRITAIQAMAASGCLDSFGLSRKQMFLYAQDYRKKLQAWEKKKNKEEGFNYPWPEDVGEWTAPEKFAQEMYYLGEGFSCGLKEAYGDFFDNWAIDFSKLSEIFPQPSNPDTRYDFTKSDGGIIEGVISDYFEFKVKKEDSAIFGMSMGKAQLQDIYGNTISMTIFPDGLENLKNRLRLLTKGKAELDIGTGLHVSATLQWYEGELTLIFNDLLAASPIPARPKDLKHKTVSMQLPSKKKVKSNKIDANEFLEDMEDEIILQGRFNFN